MSRILIGNIKGPQGAQGIQGPQGPVGATGPQGPMPPLINNALATEAGVAALDAAMGKNFQDQITQLNSEMTPKTYLKNSNNVESHSFNVAADITEDEYIVQHTGMAILQYVFADSMYSQFRLQVNGVDVFYQGLTSGASSYLGLNGCVPLFLNAGDVVKVVYYSTFRMHGIYLRLRY